MSTPSYAQCLAEARRAIERNHPAAATAVIQHAIGMDPTRPDAFNLLGVAVHLCGQRYKAQDCFRAALALDATYRPAHENLERSVRGVGWPEAFALGDGDDDAG